MRVALAALIGSVRAVADTPAVCAAGLDGRLCCDLRFEAPVVDIGVGEDAPDSLGRRAGSRLSSCSGLESVRDVETSDVDPRVVPISHLC